ncbi:MAG: hypothetical protein CMP07_00310 [Xanthomonadales bacterium]|nr:hypothetical protein [Xanthomonadales bacterium]|tara:strand:- start:439 stop:828 length:390 start_codon:yes stop_codon:yes gene_type:complete
MKWILFAMCAGLAGCASNNAGTELTGERYDVTFSARETTGTLELECAPPSMRVPEEWIDECNAIARRYLGTLVARGRISDFPDPPFGQAGQAMKGIWAGLAKSESAAEDSGMAITGFKLGRKMEWDDLR